MTASPVFSVCPAGARSDGEADHGGGQVNGTISLGLLWSKKHF